MTLLDPDIEIVALPPAGRVMGRTHVPDAALGPQLKVRELLMLALDSRDLSSPALAVALNRNPRGSVVVTVVTRDQVQAFTIEQAGRLRLAASQPTPARLTGATVTGGVISGWDYTGSRWRLDSAAKAAPVIPRSSGAGGPRSIE